MVPDLRCKVQLGAAEDYPAQIRTGLPAHSLDGMALYTSFAYKHLAPFGRVFRKYLGNGSCGDKEKNNDDSV
jgi:hypothetical protein